MPVESAPAKVNLYLHITGRRADGYHLLDSLVVFAAAADRLSATLDDALSLTLAGPQAGALAAEADNLVLRAARALAAAAGRPASVRLVLEKHLPVASGIGGGSADAAACLRLLARLWNTALPAAEMDRIALSLGADVPACLATRPLRMGGVGEVLSAAPGLPPCGLVLANPGLPVATADIFRARTGGFSAPASLPAGWPDARAMAADLTPLANDLEPPALRLCPPIGDVLAALRAEPACLLARMSGSGATCYGLFPSAAAAQAAAARLARPGWWVWGGDLVAPASSGLRVPGGA